MDQGNRADKRVVAIVPAHNEESRIGSVIEVLKSFDGIDRLVVVDDGSSDGTSKAAENAGAEVIRLEQNSGKAAAMDEGVRQTEENIILFIDADLLNLRQSHVRALLKPVLDDEVDMTMGIFRNGRFRTDIAHIISPGLSGQRAMKREVWNRLDKKHPMEKIGYGIEEKLQSLVKDGKVTLKKVIWNGVSQFTKEEKLGPQEGFKLRMKMYKDILKVWTKPFKN
jgi:glycosyltransferase involved in cell wall biosynthesis